MQTVSVLLTVLMIIVTSEAAGPQYCKHAKENVDQLLLEVNTLIQNQNDAKAKIATLTNKVEAVMQKNGLNNSAWVKLNSAGAVCFGAKDNQFGSFKASTGGNLMKIKLVHLYGYVSCVASCDYCWSHWGCGYYANGVLTNTEYIGISITDATNTILFPPSEITGRADKFTQIPGYNSRSPELVMSIYASPVAVTAGQDLRLWYTEDLLNGAESDNGGRVCADIYGYFM